MVCQPCTKIGGQNDHHPANLALCPLARPRLQATLLASQVRQLPYNNRLVADISTRIRIKGGIPEDILTAQRDLWQSAIKTDHYLAIMSQLPDMHSFPSTWDVIPGKSTIHTLHLKYHILNSHSTITIQDYRLQHLLTPGKATASKETATPTQPDPQPTSKCELTSNSQRLQHRTQNTR